MGLYKFSEVKLKIRGTTIAYWILSMLSFIIAFLTIGNFALFGQWFSVDGEGANIFMCMFAVFIAITSLFTYKKFNINIILKYKNTKNVIGALEYINKRYIFNKL